MHHYLFAFKLDRCGESCNTFNYLSNKLCVPNKTEDLNLSLFNMVIGIKESKTLTKCISSACEGKLNGRKCNSIKKWNNDKCRRCECKNMIYVEKIIFGILLFVVAKIVNI